jgi:predicted nucleic acid-binding protein
MKLVVDANVLFSFFKRRSATRRFILSHPEIEFITPAYVLEELKRHETEIKARARIDDRVLALTKRELQAYLAIVPVEKFKETWREAIQLSPDPDDAPYLAVALALGCTIWSNDKELKEKQSKVTVLSTAELLSLLS